MSAEMKNCLCCGVKQGSVEKDNADFESILSIASNSASEMDLITLIEIINRRFVTGVCTSKGEGFLAYEEREYDNAKRLKVVVDRLNVLLSERVTS